MVDPGFFEGLVQPVREAGMLMPLLATALFVGQQWGAQPAAAGAARAVYPAWAAFALSLGVALVLSLTDALPLSRVPWPSLVAAALGGLTVAVGRTWGAPVFAVLAAVLGAGVGLAAVPPPAAASATAMPWALAGGVFVGALAGALAGAALVRPLRWAWARVGVRVLASWVAAASLIVLALSIARG
ncbi:MAG: hypothetical protein JNL30_02185 [Rubrivivax sp.]|nr:hypothetical protein [Rubrivivax sp.]